MFLNSLEIHNFRCFSELRINQFSRVNLITGRNNVGKSTLLEALQLFSNQGAPWAIYSLLFERGELYRSIRSTAGRMENDPGDFYEALSRLFYNKSNYFDSLGAGLTIGQINDNASLQIRLVEYIEKKDADLSIRRELISKDESILNLETEHGLLIKMGDQTRHLLPIDSSRFSSRRMRPDESVVNNLVPSSSLNLDLVAKMWDGVALTQLEEYVISALRIVSPNLERISFVAPSNSSFHRIPLAKFNNQNEPVPLKRLGDGINRLLGIVLSIVSAKDGVILIDEFENGFHYSIHTEVWALVLELSKRLNVQVFATTHSWDCIEGFQSAIGKTQEEDGILIRLSESRRDPSLIKTTIFNERELGVATKSEIELR